METIKTGDLIVKLTDFYPSLKIENNVKGICSKQENIKKNYIYIDLENEQIDLVKIASKKPVLIISRRILNLENIPCLMVDNPKNEYLKLQQLIIKSDCYNPQFICFINDCFLDFKSVISDIFNKVISSSFYIIDDIQDVDFLYERIKKFSVKGVKYFIFILHSKELDILCDFMKFDYIIYPITNHTSEMLVTEQVPILLKSDGLLIYNKDDFSKDFNMLEKTISFGSSSDADYNTSLVFKKDKMQIFNVIHKDKQLEFLTCFKRIDYIYLIQALMIFLDNESIDIFKLKSFLNKYII